MNNVHIFTSYFQYGDDALHDFYCKELLPYWYEVNSKFLDDIHIYTDASDEIKSQVPGATIHHIDIGDTTYALRDTHLFSTQIDAWIHCVNTLSQQDTAIYLDPDAFLCTDKLIKYAPLIQSHALTKKISPYGGSDAGIAILRNTQDTQLLFAGLMDCFYENMELQGIIELYYDKTYKGRSEYYIEWGEVGIMLRDMMCGCGDTIDVVHGINNNMTPSNKIEELISKKERLTHESGIRYR